MKSDFKGDEMSGEVDKQRTGEPEFIDTFKTQQAAQLPCETPRDVARLWDQQGAAVGIAKTAGSCEV